MEIGVGEEGGGEKGIRSGRKERRVDRGKGIWVGKWEMWKGKEGLEGKEEWKGGERKVGGRVEKK